jgi:hypothetical protein
VLFVDEDLGGKLLTRVPCNRRACHGVHSLVRTLPMISVRDEKNGCCGVCKCSSGPNGCLDLKVIEQGRASGGATEPTKAPFLRKAIGFDIVQSRGHD